MIHSKIKINAFTLVELVIVVVILAILGAIAFISLYGYSTQARDSARISDLSRMKTSLELYQLDAGKYPLPTDLVDITYTGSVVWKQGTFGETVYANVSKLDRIPVDVLTAKEYTYSVTSKRNEFQIGGILEGDEISIRPPLTPPYQFLPLTKVNAGDLVAKAYVTGNYNGLITKSDNGVTCSILAVPTIITNDTNVTNLQEIAETNSFVYRGYNNLPSSYKGSKFRHDNGFNFQPNNLVVYSDTGSCAAIIDKSNDLARASLLKGIQDAYIGTAINNIQQLQDIVDLDISVNNPSFDSIRVVNEIVNKGLGGDLPVIYKTAEPNYCKQKTNYLNATYNEGTPLIPNQEWQSIDSNAACYWTCGVGKVLLGDKCLVENCTGSSPNGTTNISNATILAGAWNYSETPGACTYKCNTGYSWNGSTCTINSYSVSGSFGVLASGATINICGNTTTADGSGNFTINADYLTACNDLTVTKNGYDFLIITNGPGSLTSNITGIGGTTSLKKYSVAGNFGVNAAGATVNICGQEVIANTSGGFVTSVDYMSNCSNVSVTKEGHTCSTSVDGPSSLSSNVSNIAGSCTSITYTVSGSFGSLGNGATINVCGINTIANSSGEFSVTRNYGSNCSIITAIRSGYACTTTINGPSSLLSNTTNIAGSCNQNPTCGSANGVSVTFAPTSNLCTVGTASSVTSGINYSWTCTVAGIGSVNCSAPIATIVTPIFQSARSTYNSYHSPCNCAGSKAFDGNTSTPWVSYFGGGTHNEWAAWRYNSPVKPAKIEVITQYMTAYGGNFKVRSPWIEGSNDGVNWTQIHSPICVEGCVAPLSATGPYTVTFTNFSDTNSWYYFRVRDNITSQGGWHVNQVMQIYEVITYQ